MNSLQIGMRLRSFEREHNLLRHEVDGWCAWPILRLAVGYSLEQLALAKRESMRRAERVALAAEDLTGLVRLRPVRYLVKSSVSGLVDEQGGRYKDVWFGDLLDVLPGVVKVDGINNPAFLPRRARAHWKGDLTTTLFDGAAAALARAHRPAQVTTAARGIARSLHAEFGPDRFQVAWVESVLAQFYWSKRAYSALLSRIRPQYVLTADPGEAALVAAARERGIEVLEMQHGVIYGNHHAYGWSQYALPYRERMPIPHELLLYGSFWKEELDRNGFWGNALRVVGSLRVDTYRSHRACRPAGGPRTVLVTTQGIDTDEVVRFLSEFLQGVDGVSLRLIVKLHPAYEQRKDPYTAALGADPRVTVLLGSEGASTFDLLTRADLHVSISSTCHYEAIGLGVPTAVLPFTTHEIVRPLWEAGHARLLRSPGDLRDLVREKGALRVCDAVSGYYFAPGALENLCARLGNAKATPAARALTV